MTAHVVVRCRSVDDRLDEPTLTLASRAAHVAPVDRAGLELRRASLDEILPLRHAVLRPGLPLDAARFDGDDEAGTRHFGAFLRGTGELAACVSCMRRPRDSEDAWQVRGMATRGDLVRRGVGRALLEHALAALRRERGPELLWCNARVGALRFWERQGWTVASEVFDIPGVGPHRTMQRWL
jgi:GNAT superfamily N-acetyltransferase